MQAAAASMGLAALTVLLAFGVTTTTASGTYGGSYGGIAATYGGSYGGSGRRLQQLPQHPGSPIDLKSTNGLMNLLLHLGMGETQAEEPTQEQEEEHTGHYVDAFETDGEVHHMGIDIDEIPDEAEADPVDVTSTASSHGSYSGSDSSAGGYGGGSSGSTIGKGGAGLPFSFGASLGGFGFGVSGYLGRKLLMAAERHLGTERQLMAADVGSYGGSYGIAATYGAGYGGGYGEATGAAMGGRRLMMGQRRVLTPARI